LRANAVVTRKDEDGLAKRCDVVRDRLRAFPKGERAPERNGLAAEAGRDWLIGQGAKSGFRVDQADVVAYHTEKIPRHRQKPIELGVLDLEGNITVEAPELFVPALAAGFGKAKGFGCGLMLIRTRQ
jgi:CRISPR system Cascade subunit CasE